MLTLTVALPYLVYLDSMLYALPPLLWLNCYRYITSLLYRGLIHVDTWLRWTLLCVYR
jgi:hypothetical protein